MADIRPFRAWRFADKAGRMEELTCPPYDIISEQQRQAYLARNPHNIIRLELPRDGADPYAVAGETLRRWKQEGILQQDEQAAFYLYGGGADPHGGWIDCPNAFGGVFQRHCAAA